MTNILVIFVVMFALLFLTVPIPVSIGIALLAYIHYADSTLDLGFIAQNMYGGIDNFSLMAVPFFILAGDLMKSGGLSLRIIDFVKSLMGHVTGGFGIVTILGCMFFGAISGSGPATCAAIGAIMIPAMVENGYDKEFAAGLVTSAGVLGIIIPPSIPMVIYGMSVGASISTMFLAGFLPGIVGGIVLMIITFVIARQRGYRGSGEPFNIRYVLHATKKGFWAIMMPVLILGGIYGGIFTPTESAAVAVVYGFIVGMFIYRTLTIKSMLKAIAGAAVTSGSILIITGIGSAMAKIMSMEMVHELVADFMAGISASPFIILLIVNVLLLIVGCLISTIPAIIIFAPIFWAVVQTFDMNVYHFGLLMCFNMAIGMITPPVGLNLFAVTGMTKISVTRLTRAAVPFMLALLVAQLLITYVPQISTYLPQVLGQIR